MEVTTDLKPLPPDFKVVGAYPYMCGHLVKCLFPLYVKDEKFYEGYFGTKGFGEIDNNPYEAHERGHTQVLVLETPVTPPENTRVGAVASLLSLENALAQIGILNVLEVDSIFAKEVVASDYEKESCILRFGDQYQITLALWDYSEQLLNIAEEKLRAKESLEFYSPANDRNSILKMASTFQNYSLSDVFPELKPNNDKLALRCRILESVYRNQPEELEVEKKLLFHYGKELYPGISSWEQYLGLVEEKKKELGL